MGTSLWIPIPKQVIRNKSIKKGEVVEIALFNRKKYLITEAFGIAKGARNFERLPDS